MKTLLVLFWMLIVVNNGLGQTGWQFDTTPIVGDPRGSDDVPVNLPGYRNAYGVAVAGDGTIWTASYTSRYISANDSFPDLISFPLYTCSDSTPDCYGADIGLIEIYVKPIFIYNPLDQSIDTLRFLNMPDGSVDTLTHGSRGMATDHNGNVIFADGSGYLYKIDHVTHDVVDSYDTGTNLVHPACDARGFTYYTGIFGGTIVILDPNDWSMTYNTIPDVKPGVSRGLEVSPDGKNVYVLSSGGGILHYYSDIGVDGNYALIDTIQKSIPTQGFVVWDPKGILWFGQKEEDPPYVVWGLDPDQDYAVIDSLSFIMWAATDKSDITSGGYAQPYYFRTVRDAAFTPNGEYLYIADFYGYTLKRYVNLSCCDGVPQITLRSFTLYENYPNPFNQTTIIPFDLAHPAHIKMKVYDALGREVGTFIDGQMDAGSHQFEFNGANLASGTYYFKLTMDTEVATGRMMLIK